MINQKIEKVGEDSIGTGLYYGPCSLCKNRLDFLSRDLGFDCCWGWHPVNRLPDGRMKCFQPRTSEEEAKKDET